MARGKAIGLMPQRLSKAEIRGEQRRWEQRTRPSTTQDFAIDRKGALPRPVKFGEQPK